MPKATCKDVHGVAIRVLKFDVLLNKLLKEHLRNWSDEENNTKTPEKRRRLSLLVAVQTGSSPTHLSSLQYRRSTDGS
jgi:hypothetical protein